MMTGFEEEILHKEHEYQEVEQTSNDVARLNSPYHALVGTEAIRLLRIESSSDGSIACKLFTYATYLSTPEYEAISYCWGDGTDLIAVNCNDSEVKISRNLWQFLVEMRQRYERNGRMLWADAICINQADIMERAQQILIMPQIYATASQATVWLGSATPRVWEAMAQIENLVDIMYIAEYGQSDRQRWPSLICKDEQRARLIRAPELDGRFEEVWPSIAAVYQNNWFRRVWVIQEVRSNPIAKVYCGTKCLMWTVVSLVAQWMIYTDPDVPSIFSHGRCITRTAISEYAAVWTAHRCHIKRAAFMTDRVKHAQSDVPFLDILACARCYSASDARDIVFALLRHPVSYSADTEMRQSIYLPNGDAACDASCDNRRTHLSLQPTYDRAVEDVYLDVALASIAETGSLQILSHHYFGQPRPVRGPIWVPRWDEDCENDIRALPTWCFRASGNMKCLLRDRAGPLRIKGILVDTVGDCRHALTLGPVSDVTLNSISAVSVDNFSLFTMLAGHGHRLTTTGKTGGIGEQQIMARDETVFIANASAWLAEYLDTSLDRFWISIERPRCDICDDHCHFNRLKKVAQPDLVYTCRSCFAGDFDVCLKCHANSHRCKDASHELRLRTPNGLWIDTEHLNIAEIRAAAQHGNAKRFIREACATMIIRAWTRTSKGRTGTVGRAARAGDVIVILFGARVPFVLRPQSEGRYRLIGDCYLAGIMYGEIIDLWRAGEYEEQEFELC